MTGAAKAVAATEIGVKRAALAKPARRKGGFRKGRRHGHQCIDRHTRYGQSYGRHEELSAVKIDNRVMYAAQPDFGHEASIQSTTGGSLLLKLTHADGMLDNHAVNVAEPNRPAPSPKAFRSNRRVRYEEASSKNLSGRD